MAHDSPFRVETVHADHADSYQIWHSGHGWFGTVCGLAEAYHAVDLLNLAARQREPASPQPASPASVAD